MKAGFFKQLCEIAGKENVRTDEPMKQHTTFRIGGAADYFVSPQTTDQIKNIIELCKSEAMPWYVIGNGSNLLVSDRGFRGVIIQLFKNFSDLRVEGDRLYVQAGTLLSRTAKKALEASDLEKIRLKKGNKVYAKDGSCIYKKKTKELVVVTASKGGQVVKISPKVKKITRDAMTAGDNFIVNDGSSLDYIVIPASTILCDSWYQFYKAGYITCDVVFRGKTLPKYSSGAQNIFPLFCTYYVPKGMVKKYKNWIKKTAPDYSSIIKVKTCTKKVKKSTK